MVLHAGGEEGFGLGDGGTNASLLLLDGGYLGGKSLLEGERGKHNRNLCYIIGLYFHDLKATSILFLAVEKCSGFSIIRQIDSILIVLIDCRMCPDCHLIIA